MRLYSIKNVFNCITMKTTHWLSLLQKRVSAILLVTLVTTLFVSIQITLAVDEYSTVTLTNGSGGALSTATVGTQITGNAYILTYTQVDAAAANDQVWAAGDDFIITIPANMPAPINTDTADKSLVTVCYGTIASISAADCTGGTAVTYNATEQNGNWDLAGGARSLRVSVDATQATALNTDAKGLKIYFSKSTVGTTAPLYLDATTDFVVAVTTADVGDTHNLGNGSNVDGTKTVNVAAGALTNGDVQAGNGTAAPTGTEVSEAPTSYKFTMQTPVALVSGDKIVLTFGTGFTVTDAISNTAKVSSLTPTTANVSKADDAAGTGAANVSVTTYATSSGAKTATITIGAAVEASKYIIFTIVTGASETVTSNPRSVAAAASVNAVDFDIQETGGSSRVVLADVAETYTSGALTTASVSAGTTTVYTASTHTVTFSVDHALISGDKIVYTFGSDFTMADDADLLSPADITAFTINAVDRLVNVTAAALASKVITITTNTTASAGQAIVITFNANVVDKNPQAVKTNATSAVDVATVDTNTKTIDDLATPVQATYTVGAVSVANVEPGALTASTSTTATVTFTNATPIEATDKIKVTFGSGYGLSYVASTSSNCSSMDGAFSTSVSGQVVTITRSAGAQQAAASVEICTIANVITPPPGSTGTYTITITDSSDNVRDTLTTVTADTIVDWLPVSVPQIASVVINNNDATTSSTSVTLTISAVNATEVLISEALNFSGATWQAYATSKPFTLSGALGQKTVYVKVRKADVESNPASDTINLIAAASSPQTPTATPTTPQQPTQTPATPQTQTPQPQTQQPAQPTQSQAPTQPAPPVSDPKLTIIKTEASVIAMPSKLEILEKLGFQQNVALENSVGKPLVGKIIKGESGITTEVRAQMETFVTYGTSSTKVLGAGERAGVVNSFKEAFGKVPESQADWEDVVKIANGRWPSQTNVDKESSAETAFEKVYLRVPDRDNPKDDAAVVVMAYGLRSANRNMASEQAANRIFKGIFKKAPSSASDWDTVRAIAYSGATR